jgi:uncharacterized protein GlcG (DUF336 family)
MIGRVPLAATDRARAHFLAFTQRTGREMALVLVDEAGDVVLSLRTDGCPARVIAFAGRKAFTAAYMGRDTVSFRRQNEEKGKTLADWGDERLTTLSGGHPIRGAGGELLGAVGIGGGQADQDEELARSIAELLVGRDTP